MGTKTEKNFLNQTLIVIIAACILLLGYEIISNSILEFNNGQSDMVYVVNRDVIIEISKPTQVDTNMPEPQPTQGDFTDPYYDTGE